MKTGPFEICNKMKDRTRRLVVGEDKSMKPWKENSEDLYNMDKGERVGVSMFRFDGGIRGNILREAQGIAWKSEKV